MRPPAPSMRILFVCGDGIFAGLERITLELVKATRARGHEVLCLGSHWGSGQFTAKLRAEGLPLEQTWFGFISLTPRWRPIEMTLGQLRKLPTLWRDYRRIVREWKPDVIHHSNFHHVFLLACGPTRSGVPSVYHVHNVYNPTPAVRIAFHLLKRYVDRFIAVSDVVADSLVRLGVEKDQIAVVLNGTAVSAPDPEGRRQWRQQHGWTDDDIVVGIVGQVGAWKGHQDFIAAVALARQANPRIKPVIVGAGTEAFLAELHELSRTSGADAVFTGFVHDIDDAYEGLDIVVTPSRAEDASPLTVLEALAHGRPVIGTRRGGIPQLLGHDLAEWLVPAEDPSELARKIARLAGDARLRHDVGERGRARAVRDLNIDRCAEGLLQEYRRVIGGSPLALTPESNP